MSILTVKEESLTALGDAIRSKVGKSEPLVFPTGMVEAVNGIEAPVPIPEEAFTFTGNCDSLLANDKWKWFIEQYGNKIKFEEITGAYSLLKNCSYETWNKDINFKTGSYSGASGISDIFNHMTQLKELDIKINGTLRNDSMISLFQDCHRLKRIGNIFENYDMSYMDGYAYGQQQQWFYNCYSLREIDEHFWDNVIISRNSSYGHLYNSLYYQCNCLDKATLPVAHKNCNDNCFSSMSFQNTYRLKDLLFITNEDGTPKVANWKGQLIDLSGKNVGYCSANSTNRGYITNYNSGITADKWVKDDATYQALKNDPDWFTDNYLYSRYNHDSAVNTINSLPDTSAYLATAGGTNTIKFTGKTGSLTDGGAINTLTDAEIAVAAAKGWTVSFA